jgi:hypothetical protein
MDGRIENEPLPSEVVGGPNGQNEKEARPSEVVGGRDVQNEKEFLRSDVVDGPDVQDEKESLPEVGNGPNVQNQKEAIPSEVVEEPPVEVFSNPDDAMASSTMTSVVASTPSSLDGAFAKSVAHASTDEVIEVEDGPPAKVGSNPDEDMAPSTMTSAVASPPSSLDDVFARIVEQYGAGEAIMLTPQPKNSPPQKKEVSLSNFFDDLASQSRGAETLRQNFDDSSVALIANNLQKRLVDSKLSDSWVEGETITNWMGWADDILKASDTESVMGFEMSRDLDTDFDDDSTIGTYYDAYDDVSVASTTTPSKVSPYFPSAGAITPAKVAASILFNDSPASSVEDLTPGKSNAHKGHEQDLINMGLTFVADDIGLAAGLSFGGDDVGFDDGLGFGNEDGLSGFGIPNMIPPPREPKSPEKKKTWFPWGGGAK